MRNRIILGVCISVGLVLSVGAGWGVKNAEAVKQTSIAEQALAQAELEESAKKAALEQIEALEEIEKDLTSRLEVEESAKKLALERINSLIESLEEMEEAVEQARFEARRAGLAEGHETGYQKGHDEGYSEGYATKIQGLALHNPTYKELKAFLSRDPTNQRQWSAEERYTCSNFATDLNNNAEKEGIRAAIVFIAYRYAEGGGKWGHFLNRFETIDKGLIFIEPMTDQEVTIEVGGTYQGKKILERLIGW